MTHEVLRMPATGPAFRWRVSVAQIDVSGPFSDFSDYNRKMVLLRGSGVRLTLDGVRTVELRKPGELVEFDGAARTECELLDGPCTDLNLMVAKWLGPVRVWVQQVSEPVDMVAPVAETCLIFPVSGGLSINENRKLDPWDLGVFAPGEARRLAPDADEASLVFFATVDDNFP